MDPPELLNPACGVTSVSSALPVRGPVCALLQAPDEAASFFHSEGQQLAAPPRVVPRQALLLSGLLHRDPCRLPADMQDALLSLDV